MKHPHLAYSQRGSMLLAAILFAMVAFIMLGTMLPSYLTDYRASIRNRLYSTAFNLAEAGAEEAIWAAYDHRWDLTAWAADTDWAVISDAKGNSYFTRRVTFPNASLGDGYTGYAKVAVRVPSGSNELELISQGIVLDSSGNEVVDRIIEVDADELRPFVGFVAKDTLDLGSGTIISATNTDDHATISDALDARDSDGVVGSISTSDGSITLANSNTKTQANMTALQIGTVLTGSNIFSDAVSYNGNILNQETNFSASFPPISHPSASGNNGPAAF